jgi:hypothetical protein
MTKLARNIILLTAMAAMLLPSLYSNLLQLERFVAEIIAHEKLETENLETIRIAAADLQWYEEGRELFYNDQLFDVESFYIQNDTVIIRGLTDTRETEIDFAVNKLVHNSDFDLLITTIGENIFDFTAFQPTYFNFDILPDTFRQHYQDKPLNQDLPMVYSPVQTPPPDILSSWNMTT